MVAFAYLSGAALGAMAGYCFGRWHAEHIREGG